MSGVSLLLVILAAAPASNLPAPLVWNDNYSNALKQTQDTDKPLLVVLQDPTEAKSRAEHATDRPDEAYAELLENYELCRVDVTTEHGKQVAAAFAAESFPFMAVIDKTGAGILCRHEGQLEVEKWVELLKTYKDGQMPSAGVRNATTRASYSSRRRSTTTTSTCYT